MLASHILSKGIKAQLPLSFHWMNTTIRLNSKYDSSSSSSDSSSDSDSNTEDKAVKKESNVKNAQNDSQTQIISELNSMVKRMSHKAYSSTPIDLALKPRKKKVDQTKSTAGMSYIQQLSQAAANVAKTMGGDRKKTATELVNKAQTQRTHITLQKGSVLEQLVTKSQEPPSADKHLDERKSIIRDLQKQHYNESNRHQRRASGKFDAAVTVKGETLFGTIAAPSQDLPVLSTWEMLERRELKLKETHTPENVFQELIQWTDQGKIWKFPIDNEQGMEKEHSVHFSEHVFMERHLKGWCPKKGPIRHFMELVCVGLSKNPYMTVEEKLEHIMWYKEYFGDKQDLLLEIGAIEEPMLKPTEKLEA